MTNKIKIALVASLTIAVTIIAMVKTTNKTKIRTEVEITSPIAPEQVQQSNNGLKLSKKKIRRIELIEENTLFLFGAVEESNSNVLAATITKLDDGSEEPLYLLIDSPGGSVFSGSKVISAIEGSTRPVHTICVGLCASMGAMIHSYGHKRLAVDRTVLMFHPASGGARGPVPNMLSLLGTVDRYVNKMELNVVKRSGMTEIEYSKRVMKDFWVDAEDAKSLNLVDELVVLDTSTLKAPQTEIYLKRQKDRTIGITTLPDVWMRWTF